MHVFTNLSARTLAWLLTVGLALPSLAACAAPPAASPTSVPPAAAPTAAPTSAAQASSAGQTAAAPVEISYAFWNKDQIPATQELADNFHKAHPNITVSLQFTPPDQYWTKLQTSITGGSAPDVFHMNGPNFLLYAANDTMLPVDTFVSDDKIDTSVYPKGLVQLYTYNGHLYGLPENFATIALWYNKTLFDKAHVAYPDSNWTWQDLQNAAQKLTDKSAGVYGIAAGADPAYMPQENYYNTIYQAGGFVVSPDGKKSGLDDPNTIKGLQFWEDLLQAGVSPSYQQMLDTNPSAMFASGKVAMFYGGTWRPIQWAQSDVKDQVDVAPLPKGPAGPATTVHGLANVIYVKSPHPREAWEFLKYVESKEGQEFLGQKQVLIPAYAGTQDSWLNSLPQYNLKVYIDAVAYAVPYPASKNTAAWATPMDKSLAKAWAGQTSVADAAKEAANQMNTELASEGS